MKTQIKSEINSYITPEIVCIKLDNEISLQLESSPPAGPEENASLSPNFLINEPFKNSLT